MASASVSIDTAAGPAINPGGICTESHQVAPEGWRDPDVPRAADQQRHREVAQAESQFRGSASRSN